jgi:hypothetical protein
LGLKEPEKDSQLVTLQGFVVMVKVRKQRTACTAIFGVVSVTQTLNGSFVCITIMATGTGMGF